jgi:hypothetical protein
VGGWGWREGTRVRGIKGVQLFLLSVWKVYSVGVGLEGKGRVIFRDHG